MDRDRLFYTILVPFVIFFGAFAFIMYPARDTLHPTEFCVDLLDKLGPRFMGPIAIVRNWTYCLFYVMAELWGSVVVSVLFWGFANQIMEVKEAKQFYPLFGLIANVALIFSGQAVRHFSTVRAGLPPGVDGWGISLKGLMSMIVVGGLCIAGIYWALNKYVLPAVGPIEGAAKKKVRTEGFKFAPVKGWIAGKASAWIGGRKAEIWEATAKLARETVAPGGGFKLDGSFEEYVESANDARENVVTRAPLGESSKDKSGLNIDDSKDTPQRLRKMSARCWLVRDFPLKASQASQILDVLERANKNAAHVNRVVKYWCSNHENMFPVKIQVPLMLTIYAQVQFKDFKALDKRAREAKLRDGFFEIPSDYRVKSVDEMLAEVEERANRDMERIEALDESLDVDNETEEIRQLRVELERLAKNTSGEDEGDDEYEFDDDDDDEDEDDENLDADRMNVR